MEIKDQWVNLAKELGLEFKEGMNAFLESKIGRLVAGDMIPGEMPEFMRHGLIQKLLSSFFLGVVTGAHDGQEVFLYRGVQSHGSNRHSYHVEFAVSFSAPLNVGLDIEKLNFWTKIGRALFSSGVVYTGNQPLDGLVRTRASEPNRALRFLESDATQKSVLSLFQNFPSARITDYGVRCKEPGEICTAARAREVFQQLCNVAKLISFPQ